MQNSFAMPDAGEGLTEAEIVDWRVAVGDQVAVNQILVEVETAKAVVELPSPYADTVTELLHGPGDVVAVGTPIIVISDGTDDTAPPPAPAAERGAAGDAEPERQPVLVGDGVSQATVSRRPRRATTATSAPPLTSFARIAHGARSLLPPSRANFAPRSRVCANMPRTCASRRSPSWRAPRC